MSRDNVAGLLKDPYRRGVLMRGLGRSYGDAAQNAGGVVLSLEGSAEETVLDAATGTLTAGAGASLHDLLKVIVPQGFFVPVTPGTRFVTVGGAIASDIHGKNHHVEGSFGNHVRQLTLMLADGTVHEIGPDQNPTLFWATVGGMGLTGVILEATFSLIPIETSLCTVNTIRCRNIDVLIDEMSHGDDDHRYSVAWADLLATGSRLGRSVLWRGDHTKLAELSSKEAADALKYEPKHLATVPPLIPSFGFVNKMSSTLFNELWFRKEPRRKNGGHKSIPAYFHPLDAIGSWNRVYGNGGFLQYQFALPFGREDELRQIVERIAVSKTASPLVVLKRFGDANPAPLSFPMPGWTLTVDIPTRAEGLGQLLHSLDEVVMQSGGRHYLAKDAHTTPTAIRRGYPRLDEWKQIQRSVDPGQLWQSDLARRLELI
ncbi:MAG: FAD-binding oxidoreductase [Actinomycetota bacterium]|nr:FAD-binding oxidoreductase [Actinomycetota bacterium]